MTINYLKRNWLQYFLSCLFLATFAYVFHFNSIMNNILMLLSLFIILLQCFRALFQEISLSKFQKYLYINAIIFWLIASGVSFHLDKTYTLFCWWIWICTYFMLIMSFQSIYRVDNQDVISNTVFLIKISLFSLFFMYLLVYSGAFVIFKNMHLHLIPDKIDKEVSSFSKRSIALLILNIANFSMLVDIVKLTLTNFFDKEKKIYRFKKN